MTKSLLSLTVLSLTVTAFILGGCSLIPDYKTPDAPVPAQWPQGPAYSPTESADVAAAEQGWRQFFNDPALQKLIQTALVNNRDLRVAALNIDAYRAQYRIQRADLFPAVSATGSGSRQRVPADMSQTGSSNINSQYSATLGVSAYELDLFGRVRSLSEQALEIYLSSEQARRSTQISLVASVANAYYTWQADKALLVLTQDTLKNYEESFNLTRRSNEVGVASALDLSQARTAVEGARVKLSQYQRLVAQDLNSLTVLLGTGVPSDLPAPLKLDADQLAQVPAGLPSDLLQRRPDIQEAEHQLKAANANIGAARAAFFPSISLTANAGTLSPDMGGLFKGGSPAADQPADLQRRQPARQPGLLEDPEGHQRRQVRKDHSDGLPGSLRWPGGTQDLRGTVAGPARSGGRQPAIWWPPTRTTTAWPSAATASVSTAT